MYCFFTLPLCLILNIISCSPCGFAITYCSKCQPYVFCVACRSRSTREAQEDKKSTVDTNKNSTNTHNKRRSQEPHNVPMDVLSAWLATQKAVPQIKLSFCSSRWPKPGFRNSQSQFAFQSLVLDVAAAWRAANPSPRAALIPLLPNNSSVNSRVNSGVNSHLNKGEPVRLKKNRAGGMSQQQEHDAWDACMHDAVHAWKCLVKRPQGALPFAPSRHNRRPVLTASELRKVCRGLS